MAETKKEVGKDIQKKGRTLINEFKEFALKGNVMDMAVGVIIGGAFGKIVTSLVNDVLMPLVSLLIGNANFSNLKYVKEFGENKMLELNYGNFIQNVVDFLIMAICMFIVVKLMNNARKEKEEVKEEKETKISNEEVLLTEIRDLLKEKNKDINKKK